MLDRNLYARRISSSSVCYHSNQRSAKLTINIRLYYMTYTSTILELMPLIISIWTGVTLAWGMFAGCWCDILLHSSDDTLVHAEDKSYLISIWVANALIFLFGFIVPLTAPSVHQSVGDAILVLDVFYCVFLTVCTVELIKWNKAIYTQPSDTSQLSNIK